MKAENSLLEIIKEYFKRNAGILIGLIAICIIVTFLILNF